MVTSLYPDIVPGGAFAVLVPRIRDAARFDEKQLDLILRKRLVLHASRNDTHFPLFEVDVSVPEIDPETAVQEFIARFPHDSAVVGSPQVSHHDMATTDFRHMGQYVAIMAATIVAVGALAFVVWTILAKN